MFHFNFNGRSGKFILKPQTVSSNSGTGIVLPQSDLLVEYEIGNGSVNGRTGPAITEITITTPEGVKYIFDQPEYTQREPSATITKYEPPTAWYLTKIESAMGDDFVSFSYYSPDSLIVHKYNNEEYQSAGVTGGSSQQYYLQYLNRVYLDQISYKNRKLKFIRGSRDDAPIPSEVSSLSNVTREKRLAAIELQTTSGDLIKKFVLSPLYDSSNNRLFLSSVQEFSQTGDTLPAYRFDYENINLLPGRFSKGIDHWGFYNGKQTYNSSRGFIPFGTWFSFGGQTVFVDGADRSVDPTKTQYGILNKITYPTGGTVSYVYEQNDYSTVINGLSTNLVNFNQTEVIVNNKDLLTITEIEAESFSDQSTQPTYVDIDLYYQCNGTYVDLDRIYIDTYALTGIEGVIDINYTAGTLSEISNLTCSQFNQVYPPNAPPFASSFLGTFKIALNLGGTPSSKTFHFDFDELDSQFNGQEGNDGSTPDQAYLTYSAYGYDSVIPTNKYGPGLRINSLTVDDGSGGANEITKSYDYTDEHNYAHSSGVMHTEPIYLRRFYKTESVGTTWTIYPDSIINAGPINVQQHAFGMGDKGFAGYKRVIESIGNEGKTITKFYLDDNLTTYAVNRELDYQNHYQMIYSHNPNNQNSAYYGKPLSITAYNDTEIEQTQQEFTENETDDGTSAPWVEYETYFAVAYDNAISGNSGGTRMQPYNIAVPFLANTKVESKTYDESGSSFAVTTETVYADSTHKNPTKTTQTNSNGDQKVTTYTYAHEQYPGMDSLNMLTQPYSVLVEDSSGNDLSKTWTTWSNGFAGTSGKWLLDQQWSWEGTGTAPSTPSTSNSVKSMDVVTYDAYGNALETQDALGGTTRLFYGSNSAPFQNAADTNSAVNNVMGVYLTGIQHIQGTADTISSAGTRPASGDDLFSQAEYNSLGQLTKLIDENDKEQTFFYDDHGRLDKTVNPEGAVTRNKYFYSATYDGSYSTSAPNYVETTSGTDGFESDYESSSGWSMYGDYTFNHLLNGERVLRLGSSGSGWSSVYRSLSFTNIHAKVDFYPPSSHASTPSPYAFGLNDGSSGTPNRCSIRYNPASDKLSVSRRKNSSGSTVHHFSLNAVPDTWYTIEIEKREDTCMFWVYKRGQSRSSGEYYEESGFAVNWATPQARSWSHAGNIYLTNFEYTIDPQTSISYADGLGREIQSQVRGGNTVITTETLYDERGLPEVASRPIERTAAQLPGFYSDGLISGGQTFTPGDTLPQDSPVHAYYKDITSTDEEDYAYRQTQYEASPLARVEKANLAR